MEYYTAIKKNEEFLYAQRVISKVRCKASCRPVLHALAYVYFFLNFKGFILFILERLEGREGERKRSIYVQEMHGLVAACMSPTVDLAHNPGMCPNQESNW